MVAGCPHSPPARFAVLACRPHARTSNLRRPIKEQLGRPHWRLWYRGGWSGCRFAGGALRRLSGVVSGFVDVRICVIGAPGCSYFCRTVQMAMTEISKPVGRLCGLVKPKDAARTGLLALGLCSCNSNAALPLRRAHSLSTYLPTSFYQLV